MKNKKDKLIKNLIVLFSGTNLSSFINLINVTLLVNIIGLKNNGIIFLALSYIAIFNLLFNFQSFTALMRFLPKYESKIDRLSLFFQGLYFDYISAMIAFVLSYIFIDPIANYLSWDQQVVNAIYILNFSILFTVTGVFDAILRYYSEFKYVVYINLSTAVFNLLALALGWLFKFDFIYYIYLTLFVSVFKFFIYVYYSYLILLKNELLSVFNFKKLKLFNKDMFKFNVYSNISLVIDLPVGQLTPIIVNQYLGLNDVAVFKILEKIGRIVIQFGNVASQVMAPEISKDLANGEYHRVKKLSDKFGFILFSGGMIFLIGLYFTKQYWLYLIIPNGDNYMFAVFLYLFYCIYKVSFFAQYYIFIFAGFEKETVKILLVINALYLMAIFPVIDYFNLNGVIILLIIQASLVFFCKNMTMRRNKGRLFAG